MGDTVPHLDKSLHQVKPPAPGMGHTLLSLWPKGPHRTSKHHSLLPGLSLVLHNLIVRSYRQKTTLPYIIEHGQVGAVTSHGNERYSRSLVTCLQDIQVQQWQRCRGSNQPL